jgi:hypothetical protein
MDSNLFCHIVFIIYREVWPEDDVFGSISCPPEEELLILREIFLTSVLDTKG